MFRQSHAAAAKPGGLSIDPASLPKVDTIADKLQRKKEQEAKLGKVGQSWAKGRSQVELVAKHVVEICMR